MAANAASAPQEVKLSVNRPLRPTHSMRVTTLHTKVSGIDSSITPADPFARRQASSRPAVYAPQFGP